MRLRRRLRTIALLAGLTAAASSSPRRASAQDTDAASVAAARDHFEKARAFYGQGAYREAVAELEAAHALDPSAKDLVFNLGVVHEKLADIDEALQWFQLYTTMNLTAQER
jgi:tetratricopeptide (TPR) repeat protein